LGAGIQGTIGPAPPSPARASLTKEHENGVVGIAATFGVS